MQAFVALGEVPGWWETTTDNAESAKSKSPAGTALPPTRYPMDYYSSEGGPWSSTYHRPKARVAGKPSAAAVAAAARAAAAQQKSCC